MLNKMFMIIFSAVFFSNILAALSVDYRIEEKLPVNSEAIDVHSRMIEGVNYYFVKYIDENEEIKGVIFDSEFREIYEHALPVIQVSKISDELQKIIHDKKISDKEIIIISIGLITPDLEEPFYSEVGEDMIWGENSISYVEDCHGNRFVGFAEMHFLNVERRNKIEAHSEVRLRAQRDILEEFGERNGIRENLAIKDAINNESTSVILSLYKNEVEDFVLENDDLIVGVEKYFEPEIELTNAMIATSVDPWVLNNISRQGDGIGVYMTELSCPSAGHVTRYHRLAGGSTINNHIHHSESVSGIIRGVSPLSYLYCRGDSVLPTSNDRAGYNGNPGINIITLSGHINQSGTEYRDTDKEWDNYSYSHNIAIFKSAGNNGEGTGEVTSPGKGLNINTVGNYCRIGQSCGGIVVLDTIEPSSSFLNPQTGNQKPEICAPGRSITAGGHTFTGTSFSAPHAAGIAADFMGYYNWLELRPYYLKAFMLASATDIIQGGANSVGIGGVDFGDGFFDGTGKRWEAASTSSWSSWDASDPYPNNGYVDYTFYVNANNLRVTVALAWMNRGTYTYDNRTATYPIGIDLDLCIYNPSGGLIGCSSSFYNGYEVVRFNPSVSGTYRARISKYAVRDLSSKLHMGVRINNDM